MVHNLCLNEQTCGGILPHEQKIQQNRGSLDLDKSKVFPQWQIRAARVSIPNQFYYTYAMSNCSTVRR
jgi:hypothetical protein